LCKMREGMYWEFGYEDNDRHLLMLVTGTVHELWIDGLDAILTTEDGLEVLGLLARDSLGRQCAH